MRKALLPAAVMLIAAACGGTSDSTVDQAPVTTAVSAEQPAAPGTTAAAVGESSDAATTEPPATTETSGPSYDGPPAPDFELDLNDGTTFTLAGEQKPVFMVFWAEW